MKKDIKEMTAWYAFISVKASNARHISEALTQAANEAANELRDALEDEKKLAVESAYGEKTVQ